MTYIKIFHILQVHLWGILKKIQFVGTPCSLNQLVATSSQMVTFSLSDGFQSNYGHLNEITLFFGPPCRSPFSVGYPISVPVKNLNKCHYEDLRLWNNNFMLRSGANILCFYHREVIPEEKHQKNLSFNIAFFTRFSLLITYLNLSPI